MLDLFLVLTSIASIITGLAVMAAGDWKPHRLKFAGIALSTACAIFLAFIHTTNNVPDTCMNSGICVEYIFMGAIRNCVFVIFHIATGRDAVRFRDCDRRCQLRKNDRRNAA